MNLLKFMQILMQAIATILVLIVVVGVVISIFSGCEEIWKLQMQGEDVVMSTDTYTTPIDTTTYTVPSDTEPFIPPIINPPTHP